MKKISYRKRIASLAFGLFGAVFLVFAASAETFTAWTEQKNQTVRATINERSSNADILLLCGDSHSVLPWGKNLPESDTEGCILGASLAEQLFGGTEVEGQQILYNGRELTVRGIRNTNWKQRKPADRLIRK